MKSKSQSWRSLLRVALFLLGCAIILAMVGPLAPKGPGRTPEVFIGMVASLATFGLTVVFVRWEGVRLADVGARPDQRSALRFGLGFLAGSGLVVLNSLVLWGAGHVHWVQTRETNFSEAMIALVVYLSLSVREELAFHGYPLQRLRLRVGLWGAQFSIALVFALEHVAGGSTWGTALLGAGVGSLLFGMAAVASRGLALPIGLHAAWNFGDWMRGGKTAAGFWKPVVADGFKDRAAVAGIAGFALVTGLATLAFWWWHRSVERRAARTASVSPG